MSFEKIENFCIGLMCAVIGAVVMAFVTIVITLVFKYAYFIGTKSSEELFDKSRNIEQIQEALTLKTVCRVKNPVIFS